MYKIKLLLAKSAIRVNETGDLGFIKSPIIPELSKSIIFKGDAYKPLSSYYEVDENDELMIVMILHKISNH